jgi:tripartite-type tricarboxylate transporter receptor subunit TctC
MKTINRRALACLAASALLLSGTSAFAQGDKQLRLIVTGAAGSGMDGIARAISPALTKASGQPVVIENITGAGGVTGTAAVVRAPKDGQTLGIVSSNHAINPAIYKSMPYDSAKDVTPVAVLGTVPIVLLVNNSVPASNLKEFIALLKSRPGQFNFGSGGNGSALHLAGELFANEAKVDVKHVPYKSNANLTTDLIGGQIQFAYLAVSTAAGLVKAGKVKALGVTTTQRSVALPDVPTLAEGGVPNYSFDAWVALVAPTGVPAAAIQQWYGHVKTALAQKEVQEALALQGVIPMGMSPDKAGPFLATEFAKHAKLVKQSGATAD